MKMISLWACLGGAPSAAENAAATSLAWKEAWSKQAGTAAPPERAANRNPDQDKLSPGVYLT
jgi:hypothetical protein